LCSPGIKSINLGRAGATTWIAVDEAIAATQQIKPAAVVLRIGINDGLLTRPTEASFIDKLRVVKFAKIAWSRLTPREPVDYIKNLEVGSRRDENINDPAAIAAFDRRTPPVDHTKEISEPAQQDFKRLATAAARQGIKLFFVSYLDPGFGFRVANDDLARAAAESNSVFINLTEIGERAIAAGGRGDILLPDGHPTALGYQVEALEIMRALIDAKLINGTRPDGAAEWYIKNRSTPAQRPDNANIDLRLLRSASGSIQIDISTIPNVLVRLIAGRPAGDFTLGEYKIPILGDDAVKTGGLALKSDSAGNATIQLSVEAAARIPEGSIVVAVVELGSGENTKYFFSNILDFATGGESSVRIHRAR